MDHLLGRLGGCELPRGGLGTLLGAPSSGCGPCGMSQAFSSSHTRGVFLGKLLRVFDPRCSIESLLPVPAQASKPGSHPPLPLRGLSSGGSNGCSCTRFGAEPLRKRRGSNSGESRAARAFRGRCAVSHVRRHPSPNQRSVHLEEHSKSSACYLVKIW